MKRLIPRNWPLRAKVGALVVAASVLPLALTTWLDIREKEESLAAGLEQLLSARAEQFAREFDSTHQGYLSAATRLASLPAATGACAPGQGDAAMRERLHGALATFPESDADIRGAALLDPAGRVMVATEAPLQGLDFSNRAAVRRALAGEPVISGIYVSTRASAHRPSVAYLAPLKGAGGVRCVVALWVHADAFLRSLKAGNGLAGPGSFSVLYDADGIRIAHTGEGRGLYQPAVPLPAEVRERYVAEQRFGPRTRELLDDVLPFPEQAARALAAVPASGMFAGFGPLNGKINYGVGRRLQQVPWTVFYMSPQENLLAQVQAAKRDRALVALSVACVALLVALAFGASIVRPLRELAGAAGAIARGGEHTPVEVAGNDELARLARSFNGMAFQLREQSDQLRQANDELERRVRERTGQLIAIIDNAQAVIYAKDLDGRFLLVNNRFCQLFGLAREQVVGHTNHDIFDAATADAFHAMDHRVAHGGTTLIEEESAPSGGSLHTYLSVKCPLRDDAGQVYGIVGVSTDITDRKVAEARQLGQLQRLRLLDRISAAIAARQDPQSVHAEVIRNVEERLPVDFCAICRYDEAGDVLVTGELGAGGLRLQQGGIAIPPSVAVSGNGLRRCVRGELVHVADLAQSPGPIAQALAAAGLRSVVVAPLHVEGRVFGVLVAMRRNPHAFSTDDCEFLRQLSTHVALAAQQAQLTEALRVAYEDLRQSQQAMLQKERLSALGQMASGIAHDINNALSPAALYVESLRAHEPGVSERGRHQLEVVGRAIDDVSATVARMREFYRERGEQVVLAPVDLNLVVQQVADLTRARWSDMQQERGAAIDLRLELADGLPRVSGADHELREALTNLVFNAVDAMPQGGRLVMRTRLQPGGVAVEVQDSGIGMDEETRRRCLEPFFTTKGERGTGLGLAMVYGVAQRHEAHIEIDTAPGAGTCIRMVLPPAAGTGEPGERAVPPPRPARLLVVDDDPLLRESLADTLGDDGHTVVIAPGGAAGVDAFCAALGSDAPFDAVFTDLGMPGMDGREVARRLKAAAPGTPVILLTGWGPTAGEASPGIAEVDRVMSKPPRRHDLRAALGELLGGRAHA